MIIEDNLVHHDLHVNKACWKWRRRKVLRNKLLWPIAVPLPCTLYCIALSTIHCTRYCIALIIIQCTMYCIVLHCVLCIFLTSYCIVLDYFIQRIVLHNVWFCIFCVIVLYFLLRCFVFSFTLLCISYYTVLYFLFRCIAGNSPTWATTGATPPAVVGGKFHKNTICLMQKYLKVADKEIQQILQLHFKQHKIFRLHLIEALESKVGALRADVLGQLVIQRLNRSRIRDTEDVHGDHHHRHHHRNHHF